MARKPAPAAQHVEIPTSQQFDEDVKALNIVAADTAERNKAAGELAVTINYDGALTVDAVEDRLGYAQRRTVEACLDVGKCLLILKELTPHGEFENRILAHGFSTRTAQRFMQAAIKTAKAPSMALLSTRVKSASAFLELVTHDDDELKAIAELDDVDRMSVSQLRAALRAANEDATAKDEVISKKDNQINKLHIGRKKLPEPTPDTIADGLVQDAHEAEATACAWVEGHLRKAVEALKAHDAEHTTNHDTVLDGFIARIEQACAEVRARYGIIKRTIDPALDPDNWDVPPPPTGIEPPVARIYTGRKRDDGSRIFKDDPDA